MNDHKTPCPTLEQINRSQVEHSRIIGQHERELGGMNANLEQLLRGQTKLFDCIDNLQKLAIENRTNIANISDRQEGLVDKIENGLKEEIAKKVVEHAKGEEGLEVEKRLADIERAMWLPKMFDSKVKKLFAAGLFIAALAGIILLIAVATANMWAKMKETKFGEVPGLMQQIGASQGVVIDKNAHLHKKVDGGYFMESHEAPDGAPVTNGNGNTKK